MSAWSLPLGAEPGPDGVRFRVWAPGAERVEVVIYGPAADAAHALEPEDGGYHSATLPGVAPDARYRYRLDGGDAYPDPASRFQPEGVHGPSQVVDPRAFEWDDRDWPGIRMEDLVVYELHVGTFTPAGTFAAAAERLTEIAALGVTAVEVMPIANFPGARNWGYDGVNLFAPATSYGGADGFKLLVNTAHRLGLGVILDVVYNHLGPEGNYLPAITGGRFFTDRHHTPWGSAVDFDGPESGPVRDLVLCNARYWAEEYHVDGLRLDATHAIIDTSPVHIIREIAESMHSLARPRLVIAEDERNEVGLILPTDGGGYGLDGVWADDLHHQIRRLTAGDDEGYFAEYEGTVDAVAETLRRGWWRGTEDPRDVPPMRFVHCIQNHDQVGNRAMGERLNHEVAPAVYRAVSALLLLSPYTPLLWMGQEWAASSPFLYFTDHPEELGRLVTRGRREEFSGFSAFRDPERRERIPDPQAADTFTRSRLVWEERSGPPHAGVLALYRELLRLRAQEPALRAGGRGTFGVVRLGEGALALRRDGEAQDESGYLLVVDFLGEMRVELGASAATAPPADARWCFQLATEESRFGGAGGWGRLEPDGLLHLPTPGAVLLRANGMTC